MPVDPLRQVDRCTARSDSTGERCRNRTAKVGPFCFIHTKVTEGVRVKPSTIPEAGNGLFATEDLPAGHIVPHQPDNPEVPGTSSRMHTRAELDAIYPGDITAPYSIPVGPDAIRDDCPTNAGLVRHANHKPHEDGQNAELLENTGDIELLVPVAAGEEIFVNYGQDYWDGYQAATPAQNEAAKVACMTGHWPAGVPELHLAPDEVGVPMPAAAGRDGTPPPPGAPPPPPPPPPAVAPRRRRRRARLRRARRARRTVFG